jgi:REP element-mobilizing transposase RayT
MTAVRSTRFFHLVAHPAGNRAWFLKTTDYRAFLAVLREGLTHHPIRLVSYTILPDRWHLVVGPADPRQLLALAGWVIKTHEVKIRLAKRFTGSVYQTPVALEPLMTASAVVRRCRDVERKALAAALVFSAQDWPWCSAAERFRLLQHVPLAATPFLGSQAWIDYLNQRPHRAAAGLHDSPEPPRRLATGLQVTNQRIDVLRGAYGHQTHAHVERPEHLRVADGPAPLQPFEYRRNAPTLPVKLKPQPFGQGAR